MKYSEHCNASARHQWRKAVLDESLVILDSDFSQETILDAVNEMYVCIGRVEDSGSSGLQIG